MAAKAKLSLILVLILSVLVLYAGLGVAKQDPEQKQCRNQCRVQQQYSEEEKEECGRKCEDYHREKKACEDYHREKKESLGECQRQRERLGGEERQLCLLRCQEKWRIEQKRRGEEDKIEKEEVQDKQNPYAFEDEHFSTEVKTEQGRVDLLTKFTKKSELFRDIENYRLALLVANPNSFVILMLTLSSLLLKGVEQYEDSRESFNIELGDIVRVRAGTPIYLINRDENEKLYIVEFFRPVNLPGHYNVNPLSPQS
ncbi:hypothetical protein SCA6_014540 [Theobroma cacao]